MGRRLKIFGKEYIDKCPKCNAVTLGSVTSIEESFRWVTYYCPKCRKEYRKLES